MKLQETLSIVREHGAEVRAVFERRYRIIYTFVEDRVHVLCVRGPGMREVGPGDIEWSGPRRSGG